MAQFEEFHWCHGFPPLWTGVERMGQKWELEQWCDKRLGLEGGAQRLRPSQQGTQAGRVVLEVAKEQKWQEQEAPDRPDHGEWRRADHGPGSADV